jgi:hypothetical protein
LLALEDCPASGDSGMKIEIRPHAAQMFHQLGCGAHSRRNAHEVLDRLAEDCVPRMDPPEWMEGDPPNPRCLWWHISDDVCGLLHLGDKQGELTLHSIAKRPTARLS